MAGRFSLHTFVITGATRFRERHNIPINGR